MQRGHRIDILDHGYLEFVESWGSDEDIIEDARMSTDKGFLGWGTKEEPGDEKLLRYLWENEHTTPFEGSGLKIEVMAPILVFREWHRHRTQSYSELSARYTPLPDVNYIPTTERLLINSKTNKQAGTIKGAAELTPALADGFRESLKEVYADDQLLYEEALSAGVPKELARVHLPVGRYSRMRASANLLNWLKFLKLRMAPSAQYEIRQYANALGDFIGEIFPRTWDLFANGRKKKFLSDYSTDELIQELADRNERSAE
jgi:thymidylate synthase (FAD)